MKSLEYFSQCGEDKWIDENMNLPVKGFYVDIGAGDGITFSNTEFLHKRGWFGLCVEPNEISREKLFVNRSTAAIRKCVVSSRMGPLKFFEGVEPMLSGLNFSKVSHTEKSFVVQPERADTLIKALGMKEVSVASIDTEGTEIDVFETFGDVRPKVVIMEWNTVGQNCEPAVVISYMLSKAYQLVKITEYNMIFTDRLSLDEVSLAESVRKARSMFDNQNGR